MMEYWSDGVVVANVFGSMVQFSVEVLDNQGRHSRKAQKMAQKMCRER